jgi:hypothetical protein
LFLYCGQSFFLLGVQISWQELATLPCTLRCSTGQDIWAAALASTAFHSSSDWAAASSATAPGDKNQLWGTVPIRVQKKNGLQSVFDFF